MKKCAISVYTGGIETIKNMTLEEEKRLRRNETRNAIIFSMNWWENDKSSEVFKNDALRKLQNAINCKVITFGEKNYLK